MATKEMTPVEVYDSSSIKVLEGLEAVRLRPAMYIGSTGETGLHHLVYEVVDNSVDEALAGLLHRIQRHHSRRQFGHRESTTAAAFRSDHARGRRRLRGRSGDDQAARRRQVRFQELQSFGRFARRGRELRERAFGSAAAGDLARQVTPGSRNTSTAFPKAPLAQTGKAGKKTGTKITFKPDATIMDATEFNYDTLAQRLRELAFLNKGLTITLTDERVEPAEAARVSLQRRHRRIHQAPESRQGRAARQAHLLRRRARAAERRHADHGSGAAVQRRLLGERFQLRQQHQHRGRRLASERLPQRADAHHQLLRANRPGCSRT